MYKYKTLVISGANEKEIEEIRKDMQSQTV